MEGQDLGVYHSFCKFRSSVPRAAEPLAELKRSAAIPGDGILSRPSVVPSFWNPGSEHPLQALIGLPGGPYTRLSNLFLLEMAEEEPPATEYKYDDGTCEDI